MNLSGLTPRQWAYVLHRIERPDAEPPAHPGNPRKQNLDRIAHQLSDQLDRDELQALRDMVAGKQPKSSAYDEESGRDLDAEPLDHDASDEPLDDLEGPSARVDRSPNPQAAGARRQPEAPDAASVRPHAAGSSEGDVVPKRERPLAPGGCDTAPARPGSAADRERGRSGQRPHPEDVIRHQLHWSLTGFAQSRRNPC